MSDHAAGEEDQAKRAPAHEEHVHAPPGGVDLVAAWAAREQASTAGDNTNAQHERAAGTRSPHQPDETTTTTAGGTAASTDARPTPPGRTVADTRAWIAAGNAYINGPLLANMAAEPPGIVQNTALYCQGKARGTRRPRVVLEAIVPVHDADKRIEAERLNPAKYTAWAWGSPSDVSFNVVDLGGYHNGNRIGLVTRLGLDGGTHDEQTLREFLVHEVQHDADHSESSPEGKGIDSFDDEAWRWFKTEYRAYWLDGRYDNFSTTRQHTATHPGINRGRVIDGKNERSFACISHLWEAGTAYQGIVDAYTASSKFRKLVHRHNGVDSANATNNPKIDDFVRSITAQRSTDAHDSWVAMETAERTTVRNNREIRQLIQGSWEITSSHRVPLLGFVDGDFDEEDYRQGARFAYAIYNGDDDKMRAEARNMGGKTRNFFAGHPDFRSFAEYHSSLGRNGLGFTSSWNAADILNLLKGSASAAVKSNQALHGCFAAGTRVLMADGGSRRIEQIEAGNEVLAYDEVQRSVTAQRVLQVHAHASEPVFRAYIVGLAVPLIVTAHHRFFLAQRWVAFRQLTVGAELFFYDHTLREAFPRHLEAVEPAGETPVYNLSVDEHPNYFAGGILVHNMKMV